MIPQTSKISKQILGSSLIFSASGGRDKEKKEKPAAKNFASPSEGEAEGGRGGLIRWNGAEAKPRRQPPSTAVCSAELIPHRASLWCGALTCGRRNEYAVWHFHAGGKMPYRIF